jgi:hypothetical protein
MNDELRDHGKGRDFGHVVGDEFWKEMPEFQYTAPDVSWVLANLAQPLAILAFWALAGVAGCYFASMRLKAE